MGESLLRAWAQRAWDQFLDQDFHTLKLLGGVVESCDDVYGPNWDYCAALFPLEPFESLKHFWLFTEFMERSEWDLLLERDIEFHPRTLEQVLPGAIPWPGKSLSPDEFLSRLREQNYPEQSVLAWLIQQEPQECLEFLDTDSAYYIVLAKTGFLSVFIW